MSQSEIRCIVDIYVKPESLEKVRTSLLKIVEDSRAEDGCIEYELFENINDKFQLTLIETWASEDAFEDHLQSDHIRKVGADVNDALSKAPDIKRYRHLKQPSKKKNPSESSRFCVLI